MQPINLNFTIPEIFTLEKFYTNISDQISEAIKLFERHDLLYTIIYLQRSDRQTYIPMQLFKNDNQLTATQMPLVHGVGRHRTGDQFTNLEGLVETGLTSDNFPNAMVIPQTDSTAVYGFTTGSELSNTSGDKYWLEIWELEIPKDNAPLNPPKRQLLEMVSV